MNSSHRSILERRKGVKAKTEEIWFWATAYPSAVLDTLQALLYLIFIVNLQGWCCYQMSYWGLENKRAFVTELEFEATLILLENTVLTLLDLVAEELVPRPPFTCWHPVTLSKASSLSKPQFPEPQGHGFLVQNSQFQYTHNFGATLWYHDCMRVKGGVVNIVILTLNQHF